MLCVNHDDKNLTNKTIWRIARTFISFSMFMCFLWKVLWVLVVTLSLVSRVFTTHTQYQVQMNDNTSGAMSFRALISDASKFYSSSMSATKVSPFYYISHRDQHVFEEYSCKIVGVLIGRSKNSDDISIIAPNGIMLLFFFFISLIFYSNFFIFHFTFHVDRFGAKP